MVNARARYLAWPLILVIMMLWHGTGSSKKEPQGVQAQRANC